MQKLQVKVKNKDGSTGLKTVTVIRSWAESDGRQLFLHLSGVYGYKDEAPVISANEFILISDPHQKARAQDWWDREGKDISNVFYERKEKEDAERQDAEVPAVEGDFSSLDVIQYIRRPIAQRSRAAYTNPGTWYEWFEGRPDWWGYARVIEIRGYRYEIVEPEQVTKGTTAPMEVDQQLDVIEGHLNGADKPVALDNLKVLRVSMDPETLLEQIAGKVKEGIAPLTEKLAEMRDAATTGPA